MMSASVASLPGVVTTRAVTSSPHLSFPSPAPVHNFDKIPTVHGLDEWWHTKYTEDESGRVVKVADREVLAQKGDAVGVHLPAPSFWPLVVALGLPIVGYGLIFNLWLCVLGGLLTAGGLYSWAFEPVDDPDAEGHGHDDDGDHDDDAGDDETPPLANTHPKTDGEEG